MAMDNNAQAALISEADLEKLLRLRRRYAATEGAIFVARSADPTNREAICRREQEALAAAEELIAELKQLTHPLETRATSLRLGLGHKHS